MNYTLIQSNGKIKQFFVLDVAKLFQSINGGTIISPEALEEKQVLLLLPEVV